jgi:hypothetical protein
MSDQYRDNQRTTTRLPIAAWLDTLSDHAESVVEAASEPVDGWARPKQGFQREFSLGKAGFIIQPATL